MATVHVVDDHDAFRESVRFLLETHGIEVFDYPSGAVFLGALAELDRNKTACILSDVRMPAMSGLDLQQELVKRECKYPLVFITAHGDVQLAVQALHNGAVNFLEKPFSEEQLVNAVQLALERYSAQPPEEKKRSSGDSLLQTLSPRERQVLALVLKGKLNKLIADELGISIKTVELHRGRMMEKMRAKSLAQLFQIVMNHNGDLSC